jgi:hypothetical protein
VSPKRPQHGPTLSRRDLLRLGSGIAAAATGASAARLAPPLLTTETPVAGNAPKLPALTARATPQKGEVLSFRSRPDLRPAAPQVDINKPGQSGGVILMDTHNGPGDQGPLILDGNGDVVWFKRVSSGATYAKRAMNLRASTYAGKPVLSWFEGAIVNEHGVGRYIVAGQDYSTVTTVEAGNGYKADLHEFFLTPRGSAYLTAFGSGQADLKRFGGGKAGDFLYGVAQEIDIATGKVLFEWRSDQHVGFEESYTTPAEFRAGPWDYFHINSISLDSDGDLLISARNTWTVYKVSRESGQVVWRLGGKHSDFSFAPNAQFTWQHDVSSQPDGSITIFDNGAGAVVTEKQSRGLVLRLEPAARRVELLRQYLHPDGPILARALGSVQELAGGQTFIGWGNWGSFTQFGPDGDAVLDGRLAGSTTLSYRAFRSAWTGRPKEAPAIALEPSGAGLAVYASWNGATDVSQWLVLGGNARKGLSPLGLAQRAGFETEIAVQTRPAYVAVAALGSGGERLGVSGTLAT